MRLATLALALVSAVLPLSAQMPAPEAMQHKPLPASTSLTLVLGGKTTTLSLTQIAAMPHKTVTVHNAHAKADETYSGVPLADILTANGAAFDKTTQHTMLRSYIAAQGTDGYFVLYSTVEVFPDHHTGDVLVADTLDGKPITMSGALKLISTQDTFPMRWVQSLTKITLVQTGD
jgi:hypothetical protein